LLNFGDRTRTGVGLENPEKRTIFRLV